MADCSSTFAFPGPTPIPAPVIYSRARKKIPWNGKYILIRLPKIQAYRDACNVICTMNEKRIQEILRYWENKGYDTRPFNIGPVLDDNECAASQSRPIWPSARDNMDERLKGSFKVCIPDKREWDFYVQLLQEAKLRSLGVSHGDEKSISPHPLSSTPNISKQTSTQYPPVLFSPPTLISSTNSSHMNQTPFLPVVFPRASMSTYPGSYPIEE